MRCDCGDHAWMRLSRGCAVMVSPEDEAILSEGWYAAQGRPGYFVARRNLTSRNVARRRQELLHRRIAQPGDGMVVDHINMNPLDNRRENLRVCTEAENRLNRKIRPNKAVPLKGVRRSGNRFEALITRDGRQHYLGIFDSAEDAHRAYCAAASTLHGEFARAA